MKGLFLKECIKKTPSKANEKEAVCVQITETSIFAQ